MHQNCDIIARRSTWRFKLVYFLLIVLICASIGEVTARAFWCIKYGVPFFEPGLILYSYYPELRQVDASRPTNRDDFYDILLLGGSVLNWNETSVQRSLREQLAREGYRKVRIFNLAVPAHTSRDSWLKYASLGEARFDLVVFYHGINDARANNVPPELYREDYGHYSWYEIVNELASYHKTSSFALPYTLHFLTIRARQMLNKHRYVPTHSPREEWVHYGATYRSSISFESNLRAILDFSLQRDERVLLMTFAVYIPENYSLDAFEEKRLDYSIHDSPIELWGEKDNVIGAVAAHNEIIKHLAIKYSNVLFVDQSNLMPNGSSYFNDPCHFTTVGSSMFVKNLIEVLLPDLKKNGWPPNNASDNR